ncbi:hypothetical protein, conserved [Eimeria brunetti]|uniref:Uncharacterized protein n=1 Tax=Eimeria brunetti TaxID=51314 RepID=U6LDE2_9EIME|nr:hypothetical protein, conserved [Eimeria brunetti]
MPNCVKTVLLQPQHSDIPICLHGGGEKPELQELQQKQQQRQRQNQQRDQNEQQPRPGSVSRQQFDIVQGIERREQVWYRNNDCMEKCECCRSGSQCTETCIGDINNGNCRSTNINGDCTTNCKVKGMKKGTEPLRLAQAACRDSAAGATATEVPAAEAAVRTQRGATSAPQAHAIQVRALHLLRKLSPFPEGNRFMPSVLPQLQHRQLNPQKAPGTVLAPTPAAATHGTVAVDGCDSNNNRQTATTGVYREQRGIETQEAQQQQREALELELSEWQALDDLTVADVALQQGNDVLLPERLENLLLHDLPVGQKEPQNAPQHQTARGLEQVQLSAQQLKYVELPYGFGEEKNQVFLPPQEKSLRSSCGVCQLSSCVQASSSSSSINSSNSITRSSGNSKSNSSTDGCGRVQQIVSPCITPSSCEGSSRVKRRPGSISCWQQTAALLHSLLATEEGPEQLWQQHGHSVVLDASRALATAGPVASAASEAEIAGANTVAAPPTVPVKALPARIDWTSSVPACVDASILQQQQNAEPHLHQSLPAEIAQQILRRITSATVDLHRHQEKEYVQHQHDQKQKDQLQGGRKLQEILQQKQQEELHAHGKDIGPSMSCCCNISNCRSFCGFILRLLEDSRTQRKQHERLLLLLLQLLLLLLRQHLACVICRCDSGFVKQYRIFVVEEIGQLLRKQQGGDDEELKPGMLLLDTSSLHHQKRAVLLLQLAMLLRAWRSSCCISGSKGVVKVAYLCLLHVGVCFELREVAADMLAAAALDELSTAVREAATGATSSEAAWFGCAEAGTGADTATIYAGAATAAAAKTGGEEARAVALCSSITKAAVEGSGRAAAAAAELTASVACCFLLVLQHGTQHSGTAAEASAAGLKLRPCIREFSYEAASPAFPLLLLLLLPAVEQPLLRGGALQDTAATAFPPSLHAAEALHILRIAILHARQHQVSEQQRQLEALHQARHRCICKLLTLQQQQLLHLLEQQLMRLLSAAIRTCIKQFDCLLTLLQRDSPDRSTISRSSRSIGTSWGVVEAAAAAAEAPLCCVSVLVQLPKLAPAAAAAINRAGEADTLEGVVASLVNLLLMLVGPCGCDTPPPAQTAEEAAAAAAGQPATEAPAAAVTTAAFGCFRKLIIALTEAARSACRQIQQWTTAGAVPGLPEVAAAAARALQQCFARGAAAVMRFCLESPAAGQRLQQQEQVSDFIAAAADADIVIQRFLSSHKEVQPLQQPLACQLLQQILHSDSCMAFPKSDRRGGGNSCDLHSSGINCRSGREDPAAAAAAAMGCAAEMPLARVAVEGSVAIALQAIARFLGDLRTDDGASSDAAAAPGAAVVAAAADAAVVGRLLCTAWTRVVCPAMREICLASPAPDAEAAAAREATEAQIAPTTVTATTAAPPPAASVRAEQQHALAIIETRGSLINAFSSAMAAAAAAADALGEPKLQQPVQYEFKLLQDLQQDFSKMLQDAALAAAQVVLSTTLEDFLQQDDWLQVSDLLLELLQLLQQTACGASAAAASVERSRLAAAEAAVHRAAEAEKAYQRPPQTDGDYQCFFFPLKGVGPCSSTEHPDCIDE